MDEPGFTLREARVCIVGLGLMGGSLALALRDRVADLTGSIPTRRCAGKLKHAESYGGPKSI
jgi:prephenate dehydrogenase